MGTMSIIGHKGDVKITWNPDNNLEVEVAKKAFEENKKKGFKAFRIFDDDRPGQELEKFDKFAERILFIPPMRGG